MSQNRSTCHVSDLCHWCEVDLLYFHIDDHRCGHIPSLSNFYHGLLITLMITNVATSAWVMHIIVYHHLQKIWWKNVGQSWQLSGWISTSLCVVVEISIENWHVYDLIIAIQIQPSFIKNTSPPWFWYGTRCSQPSSSIWRGLTFPELAASMSIILPGVHTMISAPRFNSAICSEIPVPPVEWWWRWWSTMTKINSAISSEVQASYERWVELRNVGSTTGTESRIVKDYYDGGSRIKDWMSE